jgi:orotidine-5'-phosphate decarboxylase
MYVIADVKRNDIGTSADAYATAFLGETQITETVSEKAFDADAVTINGYLGSDGVKPFLKHNKASFVLVKTSNPSSGEIQDVKLENGTIYQHVANLVREWGADSIGANGYSNVGIVVGATYPEQIADLRRRLPHAYFLVPGYGAQGGTAADVVPAYNKDGLGALISASRSIMCAYKKSARPIEEFALAARDEAIRMRDDILAAIADVVAR